MNKPKISLLTFACGSNLGYILVGFWRHVLSTSISPFTAWNRKIYQAQRPSTVWSMVMGRWNRRGGEKVYDKKFQPKGYLKGLKKSKDITVDGFVLKNLSRYLQHGWCFLIVFFHPETPVLWVPQFWAANRSSLHFLSYVTEKAVS